MSADSQDASQVLNLETREINIAALRVRILHGIYQVPKTTQGGAKRPSETTSEGAVEGTSRTGRSSRFSQVIV